MYSLAIWILHDPLIGWIRSFQYIVVYGKFHGICTKSDFDRLMDIFRCDFCIFKCYNKYYVFFSIHFSVLYIHIAGNVMYWFGILLCFFLTLWNPALLSLVRTMCKYVEKCAIQFIFYHFISFHSCFSLHFN